MPLYISANWELVLLANIFCTSIPTAVLIELLFFSTLWEFLIVRISDMVVDVFLHELVSNLLTSFPTTRIPEQLSNNYKLHTCTMIRNCKYIIDVHTRKLVTFSEKLSEHKNFITLLTLIFFFFCLIWSSHTTSISSQKVCSVLFLSRSLYTLMSACRSSKSCSDTFCGTVFTCLIRYPQTPVQSDKKISGHNLGT